MPLPHPSDEDHTEFIDRCMRSGTMRREYTDNRQRYAVCQSMWENRHKEIIERMLKLLRSITKG